MLEPTVAGSGFCCCCRWYTFSIPTVSAIQFDIRLICRSIYLISFFPLIFFPVFSLVITSFFFVVKSKTHFYLIIKLIFILWYFFSLLAPNWSSWKQIKYKVNWTHKTIPYTHSHSHQTKQNTKTNDPNSLIRKLKIQKPNSSGINKHIKQNKSKENKHLKSNRLSTHNGYVN